MVDEGFKPDLVTHNIMLGGLFNGRKKDEALKLFGLMKRMVLILIPKATLF
jgi:pentatricopeptide repeat protein